VGSGDCQLCEAGKASATPAATSAAACEECVPGKYSNTGNTACSACPVGLLSAAGAQICTDVCADGTFETEGLSSCCELGATARADGSGCKPLLLCADDEYMKDEACEKCNNTMSILLVCVSLLSFVVIIYVVNLRSQQQGTMIGIKSITAFYQSAQLTTLVSIPWPKIALWAPFTVP